MPSAALHKHKEAGSALHPNQGCQQREVRLITARGPALCTDVSVGCLVVNGALNDHSVAVGVGQRRRSSRLITVVRVGRRLVRNAGRVTAVAAGKPAVRPVIISGSDDGAGMGPGSA